MARAIRVISVQRGHDPRDYTLVAFGGAGPLHAARLARELEIGRVLVPRNPGILCAMGLLLTDLRADFAVTRLLPADDEAAAADVAEAFAALAAQAERWFERGRHRTRRATAHAHRRHALRRPELRAGRSRCRTARSRLATLDALAEALPRRTASATASRRGRPGAARDLPAGGHRRGAQGRASQPHPDAGPDASGAIVAPSRVWLAESRRLRLDARSTTASACGPATASPAPPSSSRWTPRPWCCPA